MKLLGRDIRYPTDDNRMFLKNRHGEVMVRFSGW